MSNVKADTQELLSLMAAMDADERDELRRYMRDWMLIADDSLARAKLEKLLDQGAGISTCAVHLQGIIRRRLN